MLHGGATGIRETAQREAIRGRLLPVPSGAEPGQDHPPPMHPLPTQLLHTRTISRRAPAHSPPSSSGQAEVRDHDLANERRPRFRGLSNRDRKTVGYFPREVFFFGFGLVGTSLPAAAARAFCFFVVTSTSRSS
jgi:hypothetical protein